MEILIITSLLIYIFSLCFLNLPFKKKDEKNVESNFNPFVTVSQSMSAKRSKNHFYKREIHANHILTMVLLNYI